MQDKASVADPDPEDPGLFIHPEPNSLRAKHQSKSSKNHTEIY